jgi:hypothetical protein
VAVTNFTLRDLTLEGRPHLVATNNGAGSYVTFWETGALDPGSFATGNLVVFGGNPATVPVPSVNLLFSNCVFRNPSLDGLFGDAACVDNVAVRHCDFLFRDGTNGTYPHPRFITNTSISTTITNPYGGVGFMTRACNNRGARNVLVLDCTYNGNPGMIANNSTYYNNDSGDGLLWYQEGGNWFAARNVISNYGLEGMQFNAGPAAAAGNTFRTWVSGNACAAFVASPNLGGVGDPNPGYAGVTGLTNILDMTYSFVGNVIDGGRQGQYSDGNNVVMQPHRLQFHGNRVALWPAFPIQYDTPGAAVTGRGIEFLHAAGNQLLTGGHGVLWMDGAAYGRLLKNDFAGATRSGLFYQGTNGPPRHYSLLRNTLGQGDSYHLALPVLEGPYWFLQQNVYRAGTNVVNPFLDAASAPVHYAH